MARLRAFCTTHAPVGRAVTPARCSLRVRPHAAGVASLRGSLLQSLVGPMAVIVPRVLGQDLPRVNATPAIRSCGSRPATACFPRSGPGCGICPPLDLRLLSLRLTVLPCQASKCGRAL